MARFSNGYEIPYTRENKKSIVNLVYFIMQTGIRFGEKNNQWKLDPIILGNLTAVKDWDMQRTTLKARG